ncbi:hypothetical protein R3P38DRAFT_3482962, partial [Favolaschia claudopus]
MTHFLLPWRFRISSRLETSVRHQNQSIGRLAPFLRLLALTGPTRPNFRSALLFSLRLTPAMRRGMLRLTPAMRRGMLRPFRREIFLRRRCRPRCRLPLRLLSLPILCNLLMPRLGILPNSPFNLTFYRHSSSRCHRSRCNSNSRSHRCRCSSSSAYRLPAPIPLPCLRVTARGPFSLGEMHRPFARSAVPPMSTRTVQPPPTSTAALSSHARSRTPPVSLTSSSPTTTPNEFAFTTISTARATDTKEINCTSAAPAAAPSSDTRSALTTGRSSAPVPGAVLNIPELLFTHTPLTFPDLSHTTPSPLQPIDVSASDSEIFERIVTPYNISAFRDALCQLGIEDEFPFLVKNLTHGFSIGDMPILDRNIIFKNPPGVDDDPASLAYVKTELDAGRVSGPFLEISRVQEILRGFFVCSPLIIAESDQGPGVPPKRRVCRHLSKSEKDGFPSVNALIDKEMFPTAFDDAHQLAKVVSSL